VRESNVIVDEQQQRRLFDQLNIPFSLTTRDQMQRVTQESLVGKLIDSQKVVKEIELKQKQGLSIYHQNTFTNMFQSEAHNPHFSEINTQRQLQLENGGEEARYNASAFQPKDSYLHNEDAPVPDYEEKAMEREPDLDAPRTPASPPAAREAGVLPREMQLILAARQTLRSQENPSNLQITGPYKTDLVRTAKAPISLIDPDGTDDSYFKAATRASKWSGVR